MVNGLGSRLKVERVKCGLRQKDAAERINIDSTSISTYERGSATPPAEILMKLAALYNVSVDYLLGLEKKNSIYTDGLHDDQIDVLRQVANQFRADNEISRRLPNN